jgi:transcriptional regulator
MGPVGRLGPTPTRKAVICATLGLVYTPAHFEASDPGFCHAVIRAYPFAVVVIDGTASHLPLLVDTTPAPNGTLVGHVARASPHAEAVIAGASALAVFTGPHGYISPTWYATAPAVPTWNYCAVHARGTPRALDDTNTRAYLDRLASTFDATWRLAAQPEDFQAKMLRGIVAFEVPVVELRGKAKLSQNRSDADRTGVIAALDSIGAVELAAWMHRPS